MDAKPGYRTTEFWLTLAGTVVAALVGGAAIPGGIVEKVMGMVGVVLLPLGYTVARTKAKS
jgi:hypothetical protein